MPHHIPRKRFGQHFLIDDGIIYSLLEAIQPSSNDKLVEIGPGLGALTEPLLRRVNHLTIVEIDRDLINHWQKRYDETRLSIIAGDVLKLTPKDLGEGYRLVGNLPYNISTPILMKLREEPFHFIDAHFMLQKEVVDRMVAAPGSKTYGRLSVMLQSYFDIEALFDVPPTAFDPPPKVMSAVLRMVPTNQWRTQIKDETTFSEVVRKAFSQRRKTIANALKGMFVAEDFVRLNIDPTVRAETLPVSDFIRMANDCHENS